MTKEFSFRKKKRLNSRVLHRIALYLGGCLAAALLGVVLVAAFGYTATNVGVSMESSLVHGQKVLVNRTAYVLFSPRRGDVVIFKAGGTHTYIKRVVAVPGDTVQIRDGYLYVNGEQESGDYEKMAEAGLLADEITLGENEYIVLGDNRNNSEDSRVSSVGIVEKSQISGRVWLALSYGDSRMKTL
ncbi:MAG: signal peptidase I [Lachnospiraceae bacterium]|nr:signal peptidase I [Lachnospiraceae bacterium]